MSTKPKEEKTKFIVRMPDELHAQAKQAAGESFTSLNSFVLQAISEKLKRSDWLDYAVTADASAPAMSSAELHKALKEMKHAITGEDDGK